MAEDDGQFGGEDTAGEPQPRGRLELDKEQNWYGTIFGISLALMALWALST